MSSPAHGRVRVFIACSLDGFIAGRDGDLTWLPEPTPEEDYGYGAFMEETGAILMGRATYETAAAFEQWPYGELPLFVATSRPLQPVVPSVRPVAGAPGDLLKAVRSARGPVGIYLDGGVLIRAFLDAGLVDELTVTFVPVILGEGAPLFAGTRRRHGLRLIDSRSFADGLVQLRYASIGERPSSV